ncbi:carbonic anhydrase, partial [Rhodopirellula europaea]
HLQSIVDEIAPCVPSDAARAIENLTEDALEQYVDKVAEDNVMHTVDEIVKRSRIIREAVEAGRVKVIGALYDVKTGQTKFLGDSVSGAVPESSSGQAADVAG